MPPPNETCAAAPTVGLLRRTDPAAGYVLYSSATHLFFTLGAGTYGFTYDEHIGEFVLSHPNVKIPSRGQIYSCDGRAYPLPTHSPSVVA